MNNTHYIYLGIILFIISPIFPMLLSAIMGVVFGFKPHEGGFDYYWLGINVGQISCMLGSAGWWFMVTLPIGGLAFIIYSVFIIVKKLFLN